MNKDKLDQKHPNCLTFDENEGLLFVGDSMGHINVWRIHLNATSEAKVIDHFLIKHKEIEGDQINEIKIHPELKNHIYVQSRDNCIRLIDYESSRGTRVKKRFFGAKCSNQMVQFSLSTDG